MSGLIVSEAMAKVGMAPTTVARNSRLLRGFNVFLAGLSVDCDSNEETPVSAVSIIGMARRWRPRRYVIAEFGQPAVQSKHTTHREASTVWESGSIHRALHRAVHNPHPTHLSVLMSMWYNEKRLISAIPAPIGQRVLHSMRPRLKAVAAIIATVAKATMKAPRLNAIGLIAAPTLQTAMRLKAAAGSRRLNMAGIPITKAATAIQQMERRIAVCGAP